MSGSPDLSFLATDPEFEPAAVIAVRAFASVPVMTAGVQIRLGLQLVLSALAQLEPENRNELVQVIREEVFADDALAKPYVSPCISHAGLRTLQKASAKDIKSVRSMSMH